MKRLNEGSNALFGTGRMWYINSVMPRQLRGAPHPKMATDITTPTSPSLLCPEAHWM
jgi:hypothetical protein